MESFSQMIETPLSIQLIDVLKCIIAEQANVSADYADNNGLVIYGKNGSYTNYICVAHLFVNSNTIELRSRNEVKSFDLYKQDFVEQLIYTIQQWHRQKWD